jgi:hypothetical protein
MILEEYCSSKINGLVINFPKFTIEAACQHNSSETIEYNFMKLGRQ